MKIDILKHPERVILSLWPPRVLWLLLIDFCITQAAGQPLVMAKHLTYDIIYDYSVMSPAAVLWTLQPSDFAGRNLTKPKYFKQDRFLPAPRLKNSEFSFTGFQRGHLCPSGDRDGRRDWFKDTFYTSNIVPMTAECNAGSWKEIESYCRQLVVDGHRLRIVAGVDGFHFAPVSNTSSRPRVPVSLFKIAVCTIHEGEVWAWLVPNDHMPRRELDCRHDLNSMSAIIKPQVYNYIILWIRKMK